MEKLAPSDLPDIAEEDLSATVLSLLSCGVQLASVRKLPWLDPPPESALKYATDVLMSIGAITEDQELTPHGSALVEMPLHPRIGHMVLGARSTASSSGARGVTLAEVCALLECDTDLFHFKKGGRQGMGKNASMQMRFDVLNGARCDEVSASRLAQVRQNAKDLRSTLPAGLGQYGVENAGPLLAMAFPERVARAEGGSGTGGSRRFRMRDGSLCVVRDPSLYTCEFLAVARIREGVVVLGAPLSPIEAARASLSADV